MPWKRCLRSVRGHIRHETESCLGTSVEGVFPHFRRKMTRGGLERTPKRLTLGRYRPIAQLVRAMLRISMTRGSICGFESPSVSFFVCTFRIFIMGPTKHETHFLYKAFYKGPYETQHRFFLYKSFL